MKRSSPSPRKADRSGEVGEFAALAGPSPRKTGRPLSFDRAVVLERAMLTFWRHGYETTSISELTAAMGVTAPSIYAAFGDKKGLFLEAVRLYAGSPDKLGEELGRAPTARDGARALLVAAAERFTGETTPPGCLLASATASVSRGGEAVQEAVSAVRRAMMERLRERIAQDVATGVLPASARPEVLAAMVIGLIQGMSVLARDGAGRDLLVAMADALLSGWPTAEAHQPPLRTRQSRGHPPRPKGSRSKTSPER